MGSFVYVAKKQDGGLQITHSTKVSEVVFVHIVSKREVCLLTENVPTQNVRKMYVKFA